jgi:hypothetical protein
VKANKADVGVASSRAFDSSGVLSFRSLTTTLLITSHTAEEQVLDSPVMDEMVTGVNAAGLTGFGVPPGDGLRVAGR